MGKVIIGTHVSIFAEGPSYSLKKFYLKAEPSIDLGYISHPLLNTKSSYSLISEYSKYSEGKHIGTLKAKHWKLPEPLLYIKDVLYTITWCLRVDGPIDFFFGCDTLMAFTGLLLKLLGKVKRVIYYGVDYFPQRFSSPIMNSVYHSIDRICVRWADETWNVSDQMKIARSYRGITGSKYARQYTVPIGIWPDEIQPLESRKIKPSNLFYIGILEDVMGIDMVIRAMPELIKAFPKLRLDIVGYGTQEKDLHSLVKNLRLQSAVHFHGLLTKGRKRKVLFNHAGIGLAPFNTKILDARVKNADPMKLKEYMSYGIPIIVTDAISNADKIRRSGGGMVISYEEAAFVKAVKHILADRKSYKQYCYKALKYSRKFIWQNIFASNLSRLYKL